MILTCLRDVEIVSQLGGLARTFENISKQAEKWWETTHFDNLNKLDVAFKGTKTPTASRLRQEIRKALILENLIVTLIYTMFSQYPEILNSAFHKLAQALNDLENESMK